MTINYEHPQNFYLNHKNVLRVVINNGNMIHNYSKDYEKPYTINWSYNLLINDPTDSTAIKESYII